MISYGFSKQSEDTESVPALHIVETKLDVKVGPYRLAVPSMESTITALQVPLLEAVGKRLDKLTLKHDGKVISDHLQVTF